MIILIYDIYIVVMNIITLLATNDDYSRHSLAIAWSTLCAICHVTDGCSFARAVYSNCNASNLSKLQSSAKDLLFGICEVNNFKTISSTLKVSPTHNIAACIYKYININARIMFKIGWQVAVVDPP